MSGQVVENFKLCGSCRSVKSSMMSCNRCRYVKYCDRTCQQNHWLEHKIYCRDYNTFPTIESADQEEQILKSMFQLISNNIKIRGRTETGRLLFKINGSHWCKESAQVLVIEFISKNIIPVQLMQYELDLVVTIWDILAEKMPNADRIAAFSKSLKMALCSREDLRNKNNVDIPDDKKALSHFVISAGKSACLITVNAVPSIIVQ